MGYVLVAITSCVAGIIIGAVSMAKHCVNIATVEFDETLARIKELEKAWEERVKAIYRISER